MGAHQTTIALPKKLALIAHVEIPAIVAQMPNALFKITDQFALVKKDSRAIPTSLVTPSDVELIPNASQEKLASMLTA